MPENGVFHNFILAKIKPRYKGHAQQIMHAFWGVGQMSFVKHALFVDENAPALTDYEALTEYILNRIDKKSLLITSGIIDALDHSSDETLVGGKLGIDATGESKDKTITTLSDEELFAHATKCDTSIVALKQYFLQSANPITIVQFEKQSSAKAVFEKLAVLKEHLSIVIFVDTLQNSVDNAYMLLWRVVNNIDARRDIWFEPFFGIDATNKNALDGFTREWPKDVNCDEGVIKDLRDRGIIDITDKEIKDFQIV